MIALAEWRSCERADLELTASDVGLVDRLGDARGPRLQVESRTNGVFVRAFSWVGLVRFEQFDVHVVPKLAGENLGLVRLIDWTRGIDALHAVDALRELARIVHETAAAPVVGAAELSA